MKIKVKYKVKGGLFSSDKIKVEYIKMLGITGTLQALKEKQEKYSYIIEKACLAEIAKREGLYVDDIEIISTYMI